MHPIFLPPPTTFEIHFITKVKTCGGRGETFITRKDAILRHFTPFLMQSSPFSLSLFLIFVPGPHSILHNIYPCNINITQDQESERDVREDETPTVLNWEARTGGSVVFDSFANSPAILNKCREIRGISCMLFKMFT